MEGEAARCGSCHGGKDGAPDGGGGEGEGDTDGGGCGGAIVVVMAGSKLEALTGGRCRRLWHRVVRAATLPERTSVAFMLDTS